MAKIICNSIYSGDMDFSIFLDSKQIQEKGCKNKDSLAYIKNNENDVMLRETRHVESTCDVYPPCHVERSETSLSHNMFSSTTESNECKTSNKTTNTPQGKNIIIDSIRVEWEAAYKRLGRYESTLGNDFILKLDRIDGGLNHGQILYYDGHLAVRFEIMPTMCLEFECRGFSQIARLAYEIGNLHAPLFFAPFSDGILLIVPEDYILAKYFYNRGFKIERRWHILEPKMRFSLSFALPKEPRVVLSENFSITKV